MFMHQLRKQKTVITTKQSLPQKSDLGVVSVSFKVTLPVNSVNVIKLVPVH